MAQKRKKIRISRNCRCPKFQKHTGRSARRAGPCRRQWQGRSKPSKNGDGNGETHVLAENVAAPAPARPFVPSRISSCPSIGG